MPENTNIYSYYTDLLDNAVANQDDYADSIPTLQYYTDRLNQPNEAPDRDYSYYEADAKEQATADVQESRENPELYGFIPGEWLPDWVKSGYNGSIEGLSYQIATGKEFYDLSGYEESNPGVLEDIGSTIVSFLTPTDIAAMIFGGGIGGLGARAVAKAGAREVIEAGVRTGLKKGLAKETVEALVEKNAVQATQLLMKNNVKKDVAEKVIADATKKVSNKIYAEAAQGATGLGFYSGLQSALGQEVQTGDISAVQTLADASKGAMLGGVTAGTGKAFNNYLIGKIGKPGTKAEALSRNIAVKALEVAEFGTLSPALQGEIPRPEDFAHAAGVIGGLTITKAIPKGVKKLAGREEQLLTSKEFTSEAAKAEYEIRSKEAVWKSKDGTELSNVTFSDKLVDGKKEYVVITEPLQEVLDKISVIKQRPGYEKYKFVSWLFPSIRSDKKRIQEPGYQQSDYTRTKDNKTCWNAVKEMAQVGGARKLLRKYYSSNAVEVVGDEAIKLTGHDLRSTLDKHY